MNRSDAGFNKYLQEIGRFQLLTAKEEAALARKIKQGDIAARDRMIKANLRLVVTIAGDYVDLGLPMVDLVSEGSIGLTKAVERFDPTKGAKLSTYAAWWIKQSIKLALSNQTKTIRLPVHLVEKISKVRRLALEMSHQLGREPSDEELAEEIGMSVERVAELRNGSPRPASLEAVIDEGESTQLGEIIADEDAQTSYDWLRDQDLQRELKGALHILDDREKKIVFQRFGLDGSQPKTLEQLGAAIGLTRERIRQLQTRALQKLRRALTKDTREVRLGLAVAA
jgi:RNA polymerase primary sigma factor